MESNWTPPGWDWETNLIEVETSKPGVTRKTWRIHGTCRSCGCEVFTARSGEYLSSGDKLIESLGRLMQTIKTSIDPDAPQILRWTGSHRQHVQFAPDGGDIHQDSSDVLECRGCGTTWYLDGTGGELRWSTIFGEPFTSMVQTLKGNTSEYEVSARPRKIPYRDLSQGRCKDCSPHRLGRRRCHVRG